MTATVTIIMDGGGKRTADGDGMMDVLYLCDGARCAGCSREYCRHTADLAHALHYDDEPDAQTLEAKFDRYGDYWVERD